MFHFLLPEHVDTEKKHTQDYEPFARDQVREFVFIYMERIKPCRAEHQGWGKDFANNFAKKLGLPNFVCSLPPYGPQMAQNVLYRASWKPIWSLKTLIWVLPETPP